MGNPARQRFAATPRFEVLRCVGSGGMGTVYEAVDKERNTRVALKTLNAMTGESLLRFKKEFRDFQNLNHPNLVSVGELFSDGAEWFFSMELVDGKGFIDHVRPLVLILARASAGDTVDADDDDSNFAFDSDSITPQRNPIFDEARLRAATIQLAEGLNALHTEQKVHCDIKPSNVLVTAAGRVVLLDFGLAVDLDRLEHKNNVEIVGTVRYMAPEQAAGRQPGPPADWYAMGAMLFEALTGHTPFDGSVMTVLMDKQHLTPPTARSLNPGVPEDLNALCAELLRFNPTDRPTGAAVLRRLGALPDRRSRSLSLSASSSGAGLFVGRGRQLEQLHENFELSRQGARIVALHGESGVGKSALVHQFVNLITKSDPNVVVLRGTCYERESVPFKAVDGIIDSLSEYLQRLPKAESAAVLPRKAALLAQVFPVLKRIEAVAEAPRSSDEPREPREQRSRLFEALRELFQRLSDRKPVVLAIDDMQWADADSLTLLSEVLRAPDSPALLLVATVRTAAPGDAEIPVLAEMQTIQVERLTPAEGRELALALIGHAGVPARVNATQVAHEAAGHPLFIHELVRHASVTGAPSQQPLQLEEVLWSRVNGLDPIARNVLQLVCLANGKLVQQTAARAAELGFGVFAQQIALLRVAHLVRTTGVRATDTVAPYHSRVRSAVLGQLPKDVSAQHRRIAVAVEMSGLPDPEALATHWREAGDPVKAAHFSIVSAEKAETALAFDRAVTFYRSALELGLADEASTLRVKLAEALVNAGRSAEASAMFLTATEGAADADAMVLRQLAAEQLLRAGHVDEALELFRTVQAAIDMPLAPTPSRALAGLVWSRTRLRVGGLRFREKDASQVSPKELGRIDTGFAIALSLSTVDTIRGADLQTRQLLAALSAGEPYRIARGVALEAAFNAAGGGTKASVRTQRLVRTAQALAERIDNPHALGLAAWAAGSSAYLEGRFATGRTLLEQAVEIYRGRCRGVAWEVASAQVISLWALLYLGSYRQISERLPALIKDADAREDRYDATNLRTSHTNTVWLALDRPDRARAELAYATKQWVPRTFQLPHYYAMHALTQNELYVGDAQAAWTRVNDNWPNMQKALLMRLQIVRVEMSFLRARCALALACAGSTGKAPPLLSSALRDAKLLEAEQAPWAAALALLVRAGVEAERDANAALDLYRRAALAFDAVDMALHAAVARRRHGMMLGGSAGTALIEAADRWMSGESIGSPVRMTALIAPGRRPDHRSG